MIISLDRDNNLVIAVYTMVSVMVAFVFNIVDIVSAYFSVRI